jgi:hypothetical protein
MERFHNIEMVYIVYPISWVVTIVAHAVSYVFVRKRIVKK